MPGGKALGRSGLRRLLSAMDRKSYKLYKRLLGVRIRYDGAEARFTIVQGDPHAPPSVVEVRLDRKAHGIPTTSGPNHNPTHDLRGLES